MGTLPERLVVSAPGRICLFGEHQDYLKLPVITAAINLRIRISGRRRKDRLFRINLPDIKGFERFELADQIPYVRKRDYFRSVVNVLHRQGVPLSHGFDCKVHGEIPINSGTASSSALTVAWVKFLLVASGDPRAEDPLILAQLAHQAEVVEFDEPGGMMDHYTASFGGILFIDFRASQPVRPLPVQLGTFVLGDSLEPKDTQMILNRVKKGILGILEQFGPELSLEGLDRLKVKDILKYQSLLPMEKFCLLQAVLEIRDITYRALSLLQPVRSGPVRSGPVRSGPVRSGPVRLPGQALGQEPFFHHQELGHLLSRHQYFLRESLKVSTPKLDRLLEAALKAGALGGKLNGSGGGGCMFAYCPEGFEAVAQAIEKVGGKAYVVRVDEGARVDEME